jgi:hypothetical protein
MTLKTGQNTAEELAKELCDYLQNTIKPTKWIQQDDRNALPKLCRAI